MLNRWRKTVNIKPFIGEDTSDTGAQTAARNVRALLQEQLQSDLNVSAELRNIIDAFGSVVTCDDFNGSLEALYDWADDNRVWLGLV